MVVTAIVAILAAIAYPSYQRYVARTHRNAAAACLSQLAQFMERYYTTSLTYVDANPTSGCQTENGMERYYRVELANSPTQSAYTLRAVPSDAQRARDAVDCGTLTIDHRGTRTPTNNACW
jgi:type IV pilus assembly protein PilE